MNKVTEFAKKIKKSNQKLRNLIALVLRSKKRTRRRIKNILDSLNKDHQASDHADVKRITNLIGQLGVIIDAIKQMNISYEILERSDNSAINAYLKFDLEIDSKKFIVNCRKLYGKWMVFNTEGKNELCENYKKTVLLMCYLEYNHVVQKSNERKIDYIIDLLNI